MQHDLYKAECLLALGKNFRLLMRYDDSLRCLKKSLQYLWRTSEKHPSANIFEVELYQELAYSLLHVNELEQSEYFRNRYERGTVESRQSNIIKLSNDILKTLERDRKDVTLLTPSISVVLGVDFIEMEAKINTNRRDRMSYLTFKEAAGAINAPNNWEKPL
jgi:hypothetical protein